MSGSTTNHVHPLAMIGPDVTMGSGNTIGPFAVLMGRVVLGDDNWIGSGVTIGAPPEVRGWEHPQSWDDVAGGGVEIGDRNVLREHAQVHQGWKAVTTIGNDAFIMNQVYLAHDVHVGDSVTLASSVLLAGHSVLGDHANLGMATTVHQRVVIGEGVMIGMSAVVTRDVPPFAKAYGSPARVRAVNTVGMQRRGFAADDIALLEQVYAGDASMLPEAVLGRSRLSAAVAWWSEHRGG